MYFAMRKGPKRCIFPTSNSLGSVSERPFCKLAYTMGKTISPTATEGTCYSGSYYTEHTEQFLDGMYYGKIDGVDYVIDCTMSQGGLALNKMSNQRWTKHGKCPFVGEYVTEYKTESFAEYFNDLVSAQKGDRGEKIEQMQIALNHANEVLKLDFEPLETDGIYGGKTDELADRVKQLYFIDEDGIGIKTLALLCSLK